MNGFCLIDFDDSFTFNIISVFSKKDILVDLLHWRELNTTVYEKYDFFILGPGPGHVDDYRKLNPILEKMISNKRKFILGICLGHQLIFNTLGAELVRWEEPLHGRSRLISNPPWLERGEGKVQFYNSWGVSPDFKKSGVELQIEENKVLAARGPNFFSYQFHPESVGTTCPDAFFDPIFQIYYNGKDELSH